MAFPVIKTTAETAVTTAGTTHAITLPSGIVAGEGILIISDKGSTSGTFNSLAGWTELLDENLGNGIAVWYRDADGTEGATVTFTHSSSTRSATIAYRLFGHQPFALRAPELSTVATGTSTGPDASTCTPTGGAKDYLWISFAGMAGEEADDDTWGNTPPTNYLPNPPTQISCGVAGTNLGGLILAASRSLNASSEDAGAFNVDVSAAWRAYTIAIHPAVSTWGIAATMEEERPHTPTYRKATPQFSFSSEVYVAPPVVSTAITIDAPAPMPVPGPLSIIALPGNPYIATPSTTASFNADRPLTLPFKPKPIQRPMVDPNVAWANNPAFAVMTSEVMQPPPGTPKSVRVDRQTQHTFIGTAVATYPAGLEAPPVFAPRARSARAVDSDVFIAASSPATYPAGLSTPHAPSFRPRVVRAPESDVFISASAAAALVIDDVTMVPTPGPISTIVISRDVFIAPAASAVYPQGLTSPHAPGFRLRSTRPFTMDAYITPPVVASFVFADTNPIAPQFPRRPQILRSDRSGTFGVAFAIIEYNSGWDATPPPLPRVKAQQGPFLIPEFIPITPPSFRSWLEPVIPRPTRKPSPIIVPGSVDIVTTAAAATFSFWDSPRAPFATRRQGIIVTPSVDIVTAASAPAFSFWDGPLSPVVSRRVGALGPVFNSEPALIIPVTSAALDDGWASLPRNSIRPKEWVARYLQAQYVAVASSASIFADRLEMGIPAPPRTRAVRRPEVDFYPGPFRGITPDYGWTMLMRLPVQPKGSLARFVCPEFIPIFNTQPDTEGLEFRSAVNRLHYVSKDGRLHYVAFLGRIHYRTRDEDE